jgi:hypothetical protein
MAFNPSNKRRVIDLVADLVLYSLMNKEKIDDIFGSKIDRIIKGINVASGERIKTERLDGRECLTYYQICKKLDKLPQIVEYMDILAGTGQLGELFADVSAERPDIIPKIAKYLINNHPDLFKAIESKLIRFYVNRPSKIKIPMWYLPSYASEIDNYGLATQVGILSGLLETGDVYVRQVIFNKGERFWREAFQNTDIGNDQKIKLIPLLNPKIRYELASDRIFVFTLPTPVMLEFRKYGRADGENYSNYDYRRQGSERTQTGDYRSRAAGGQNEAKRPQNVNKNPLKYLLDLSEEKRTINVADARNLFRAWGLSDSFTIEGLRSIRSLILSHIHPDKFNGLGPEVFKSFNDAATIVNMAFNILSEKI